MKEKTKVLGGKLMQEVEKQKTQKSTDDSNSSMTVQAPYNPTLPLPATINLEQNTKTTA